MKLEFAIIIMLAIFSGLVIICSVNSARERESKIAELKREIRTLKIQNDNQQIVIMALSREK